MLIPFTKTKVCYRTTRLQTVLIQMYRTTFTLGEKRFIPALRSCNYAIHIHFAPDCVKRLSLPPMKIFAFLMAVLVLALSVLPCADRNVTGKSVGKTMIVKAAHPQEDSGDDDCSPFCQCSCCANFSIHCQPSAALAIVVPPQEVQTAGYPSSDILNVSLPIWQPPQLV